MGLAQSLDQLGVRLNPHRPSCGILAHAMAGEDGRPLALHRRWLPGHADRGGLSALMIVPERDRNLIGAEDDALDCSRKVRTWAPNA
jgi:hypothetical protein